MAKEIGLLRPPASVAELQHPSERRSAVRHALLTPLQLVPFLLVPVFMIARSRGWVADVPLWILVGSVFVAQWGSNFAHALWPAGCPTPQMVIRVGVMVCGIALAMYSTGWGPVFAFGFVFAAAENIRVDGSRVAGPVIAWMIGATVLGQLGIALGWIPSLVPEPQIHGGAILAVLGSALVIVLLRWSTAGKERLERDLIHLTLHDPLTGLPNRLLFRDRLEQALAGTRGSGLRVGVLFLDLDRFKNVNDSRGHDVGDALLVEVARRLERAVRSGDTLARFGGDEFSVLCEDLPAGHADAVARDTAQRLCAAITPLFVAGDTEMLVGGSIGIAIGGAHDRPDDLLRDADTAMYQAKASGLGRIAVFDDELRERVVGRDATEHALRKAVGHGELRLFFQPIVHLGDGRCVGCEALVRWVRADRGIVEPANFIEIAEESGLIVPLGAWVLDEAVRAAARWAPNAPDGFVVAVNVSPRQLEHDDFVVQLQSLLRRHAVDPRMLCLEITEGALTAQTDTTLGMIRGVKSLGCSLSIDDFGTGYSSLSQFKWLPLDSVKVDRSFVGGLGTDHKDSAIVAAVVGLGQALGLRVIAEGVETTTQISELLAMGCEFAQGFRFARPRPIDDFADLVRGISPFPAT
jgi:diguanylate cyclase (GGDEF)-like protein